MATNEVLKTEINKAKPAVKDSLSALLTDAKR
jgi:flagellar basal body-associated protein FliL